MLQYHFSTEKACRTRSIDFGLLSEEDVRGMSVVELDNLNLSAFRDDDFEIAGGGCGHFG